MTRTVDVNGGETHPCVRAATRRTKGAIRSSLGRRPSLFLLNKIHQDSVSLTEYITFAKITSEREISLQTVTPAFRAIWEEVQTLTTDGVSDNGLFRSLSHPVTYQSSRTSPHSLKASPHSPNTVQFCSIPIIFYWSSCFLQILWWLVHFHFIKLITANAFIWIQDSTSYDYCSIILIDSI